MSISKNNRRKKVLERFKNRIPTPAMVNRLEQDNCIIDATLKELYNEGDKITKNFTDEILHPNKIVISEKEAERVWDILLNSGLVNAVIGFGNAGKLSISNDGYQLMNKFGSYKSFIEEREKQLKAQQQSQNFVLPQFLISPSAEEEENEADSKEANA
jgi:hypothetical protein